MSYKSRIPADAEYMQLLGRAFYNFTYLEWVVIWTIVKLSNDDFGSVPSGNKATAGAIRVALEKAIQHTAPPLSASLHTALVAFHRRFRLAIKERNTLLHAHPYTTSDGAQGLTYEGGVAWPVERVVEAARLFEEAAIEGNDIFHGALARERP